MCIGEAQTGDDRAAGRGEDQSRQIQELREQLAEAEARGQQREAALREAHYALRQVRSAFRNHTAALIGQQYALDVVIDVLDKAQAQPAAEASQDALRAQIRGLVEKWRAEAADEQRVSFCADELDRLLSGSPDNKKS